MTCTRCHDAMREHDFFGLERRHGFMWMKGWRCRTCGYAADPLPEANRRLCLVDQAVRLVAGEPSGTMFSIPWHYGLRS